MPLNVVSAVIYILNASTMGTGLRGNGTGLRGKGAIGRGRREVLLVGERMIPVIVIFASWSFNIYSKILY